MENEAEKHSVHKSNWNVEIHGVGAVGRRGIEGAQILANGVRLGGSPRKCKSIEMKRMN